MTNSNLKKFQVEIPFTDPVKMEQFQETMQEIHNSTVTYIKDLATQLDISEDLASDIWYLRTRTRWSESLEARILKAAKAGWVSEL